MNGVDTVRQMFALAAVPPFDVLSNSELLLIVQHTRSRNFAAGETIFSAGQIADMLIVTVSGHAEMGGNFLPAVFDAPSILFSLPVKQDIVAGLDGLDALCLAKPHLFTIARECPDFVVGLARHAGGVG